MKRRSTDGGRRTGGGRRFDTSLAGPFRDYPTGTRVRPRRAADQFPAGGGGGGRRRFDSKSLEESVGDLYDRLDALALESAENFETVRELPALLNKINASLDMLQGPPNPRSNGDNGDGPK